MNIKQVDKILFVLAVVLLAVVLVVRVGFISGGSIVKEKRVNLVFTQLRESEWGETAVSSLIEEYERLNPAINIHRQLLSYDEVRNASVETETAGPDIIVMEGRYLAEFIKAGTFSSLEPQLYSEMSLGEWVLPLVSSINVLFYNIDILKAAGFDRPPRNRMEFLRYAQAVSGSQQYGAALALSPADGRAVYRDVFSWIWAAGAALTSDGEPKFSGKQINDTLAFLAQLDKDGLLAPQSFIATGSQRIDEFAAGKIAMIAGSMEDIAKVQKVMKDGSFGITLIPAPADYAGKPVFGLSTWYAGIGAKSEYPDEAREFLLYLRENSGAIAEQIRVLPGSAAAPYITADPFYAKAWDMYEAAGLVEELTAFPKVRELENAVREELEKMFAESRDAVDLNTAAANTAAAIQKRWE
ncbi:sugar ABC transporter substrate-binding protein [Spirochaetia bacterium]|nr:sugar ABC transporter substrate-binding protein [Spirochaetia bacterium]